jgi:dCMP deaminase
MMEQSDWDLRGIRLAQEVATWAKCPGEHVGAVVVTTDYRQFSPGYNGAPRGYDDSLLDGMSREQRNSLIIHAEVNALINAPFDVTGCTLYVTKPPCLDCAKLLVQFRIARLVTREPRRDSNWYDAQATATHFLISMNVGVTWLSQE